MTVASTTNRVSYIGTGSVGPFSYPFRIFGATDLTVTSTTNGVDTTLAYPSAYTVSGVGNTSGGSITLTTALAVGSKLTIRRVLALLQGTSIRNQGPYNASVIEDQFDATVMIEQQLAEVNSRTMTLAASVDPTIVSPLLPAPLPNNVLLWNASGTALTNGTISTNGIVVPGGGRTVTSPTSYLANNAVFNAADWGPLPSDGITLAATIIQNTINAASAAGAGLVIIPYLTAGYSVGTVGLTIPSNITLLCPSGPLILTYSGTGIAVDAYGATDGGIVNLYIKCTANGAVGVRLGNVSRMMRLEHVTVQHMSPQLSTSGGFVFDAGVGAYSGVLSMDRVYSLGFKYGYQFIGVAAGSTTWTTMFGGIVQAIGATPKIAGSIGLWADANTNLEGSSIASLIIEGFTTGVQYDNASGCFGIGRITGGIEGNTTETSFPAVWSGDYYNPHAGGHYERASANGIINRWDKTKIQNGFWTEESFYDRIFVQYDGNSNTLPWGLRRGGSQINGEAVRDIFIVSSGAQTDTAHEKNYYKLREFKTTYNTAAPTAGSWGQGSICWNTLPDIGKVTGWSCSSAGTFKAAPGVTATTTINLATVTVSALGTLEAGDYITVAGAITSPTMIVSIAGLILTMAALSGNSVAGIAVVYPTPAFRAMSIAPGTSANNADTNVVMVAASEPTQLFQSNLTANRTCKLPAPTFNGQRFSIVRGAGAGGAFTLTVQDNGGGTLGVLATAGRIDVESSFAGPWIVTGFSMNNIPTTAITSPTAPSAGYVQAEAQSMKTTVDAIRTALQLANITL